ncbi:MAG: Ppx/GppA phosphatase family protein [Nitrospiraceae bacterium]|nr:Ppx/GppA phosphatase family protein [Nitrospiraceae bacterium]
MILAGIDIGTNSIRMLIADLSGGGIRELASERVTTRLGRDLLRTGRLAPDAMQRSRETLRAMAAEIRRIGAEGVSAVGTSALRKAANAAVFIEDVRRETGIAIRVISGEEEARLTLLGVRAAVSGAGTAADDPLRFSLVFDIGGGSTELIVTREGTVISGRSLHLGAVYLTEHYLRTAPPDRKDLETLGNAVRTELHLWAEELRSRTGGDPSQISMVAGTAGTVTTLAAMDLQLEAYDAHRINGHVLSRGAVDSMVERLAASSLPERRRIAGLEAGREDIILAGAIVCREILDLCGKDRLLVSDWGLREGILIDLYGPAPHCS